MMETGIVKKQEASLEAAAVIREASREGRLISESEVRLRLAEEGLAPAGTGGGLPEIGDFGVEGAGDLREIAPAGGERHYYSSESMTETFALLLLRKKVDRTGLVAEIVRESCAAYPRPVPLDMFADPPFGLTAEDMAGEMERMGGAAGYEDIAQTATSTGRVFLYSTLHLEPDHASMLAEWIDVGRLNNP